MTESRLYKLLSRFVDIRPHESRVSFLLFLYFFLVTFPAYIIKPVKLSLLQAALPNRLYPLAPLLTAALIGFVVSWNAKLLNKLPRRAYISLTLVFFIACLVLFRLLLTLDWKGLSLIYWFWSDVFIATTVIQFWIAVNDAYNPHQAKRLIGFFVSGGLLGGIGGSLLSFRLARLIGTENLLLICPALLLPLLAVVNIIYRGHITEREDALPSREEGRPKVGYLESFRLVKKNRYLVLLAGILASATIVGAVIEQQFLTITNAAFPAKDVRTAFMGAFLAGLLVFSYIFHMFMTNRVLKKSGVRTALLIAPVFLFLGSALIFLLPAALYLGWAVSVKGADKSLDNTLSQSVRELLYIPVPTDIKYKAKIFIDMFVSKFASGLGALLNLFFFSALHASVRQLSLVTAAVAVLWIALIRLIYSEYINIVKYDLERKWQDGDRIVTEHIDLDMTRLVFDTIQSREKSSVLYSMNLFDLIRKDKMTPELKEIVSYKSDELRAKSMGSLLEVGGETLFPDMGDILEEEDVRIQIDEIMALDSYKKVMEDHLAKTLREESGESEVARMEAAKVIGMMQPTPTVIKNLRRLLRDPSPEVLTYALESAAKLRRKELAPLVIRHLASPMTRQVAADALAACGTKVMGALKDALFAGGEDLATRKAVPAILAKIGTQKSADLLMNGLGLGDGEIEDEVIEALHKLKDREADIRIKKESIRQAVMSQIKRAYAALLEPAPQSAGPGQAESAAKTGVPPSRIKIIFELLSLAYPFEDMVKAYQNLSAGTRKSIDYSLELLDNILSKELKTFLFPLLEDLPPEERVRLCRKLWKNLANSTP